METPRPGRNYTMPGLSPEVRSRSLSPERVVHTDSASTMNTAQGIPPSVIYSLDNTDAKSMAGEDIRLPTFNGNGAEDPEQHWFLCEAVCMVRQVHNADIKKVQMIMNPRGCTLD